MTPEEKERTNNQSGLLGSIGIALVIVGLAAFDWRIAVITLGAFLISWSYAIFKV